MRLFSALDENSIHEVNLVESVEFPDMPEPSNKQRLEGLEARMGRVEVALNIHPQNNNQKRDIPWPFIGPTLVIVVTIILSAIGATHTIDQQTGALGVRITKAEDAIKVLGNQQSDQTQKLIHDLLGLAKNADKPEIAARAAQVAASLTATLREQKRSAVPEFFEQANQDINALRLKKEPSLRAVAFTTQQQLAEYRSALQTGKPIGSALNCASGSNPSSLFGASGDQTKADRLVQAITITNCPQILDGFTWRNVVFINSRILYKGGPVVLDHVVFLNCTFQTQQNDEGIKLLQYAILDENTLSVKPEFFKPS